jgi:hypothetical protein
MEPRSDLDLTVYDETIVHSWDFDGMLASKAYTDKMKELIIRAANEGRTLTMDDYRELADHIINVYKEEFFDQKFANPKSKQARHVLFVGSDRQDRHTDKSNGSFKGKATSPGGITTTLSCFPFFEALAEQLPKHYGVNLTLDKLLLEDLYQGLRIGTVFDDEKQAYLSLRPDVIKAMAETYDGKRDPYDTDRMIKDEVSKHRKLPPPVAPRYIDKQKFLVMYAQIHYADFKYGHGNQMEYRYMDDRKDILTPAYETIEQYSQLFPSNVSPFIEQFLPADAEFRI